ncbi:MAG: biotin/lipoyl-binding protein, partial [Longimicrobiales bacterium]
MRKRKIAIAVVVLAALATVVWLVFFRGSDVEDLAAAGTVEATSADLGFQVSGRIAAVTVDEGARVGAGDVLARL